MKPFTWSAATIAAMVLTVVAVTTTASAQTSSMTTPVVTGVLGSPSATTTLDGAQLPPPDPAFGGVIKERASQSTPWWAPRVVPPEGAPNCS
jgi:arylsulfatase